MRQDKSSILMLIYDAFGAFSVIWSTLFVFILSPTKVFFLFFYEWYVSRSSMEAS